MTEYEKFKTEHSALLAAEKLILDWTESLTNPATGKCSVKLTQHEHDALVDRIVDTLTELFKECTWQRNREVDEVAERIYAERDAAIARAEKAVTALRWALDNVEEPGARSYGSLEERRAAKERYYEEELQAYQVLDSLASDEKTKAVISSLKRVLEKSDE